MPWSQGPPEAAISHCDLIPGLLVTLQLAKMTIVEKGNVTRVENEGRGPGEYSMGIVEDPKDGDRGGVPIGRPKTNSIYFPFPL